jgi:hypothetical protein
MRGIVMKPHAFLGLGLVAAVLLASTVPGQGGFLPGDLYLQSTALVNSSSLGGGLMRIDPFTGATQLLVNYTASGGGGGTASYDPFRDRIVAYGGIGASSARLWAIDASGSAMDLGLPLQSYALIAPRGDGIVYCRAGPSQALEYVDPGNVLHSVVDAAGVAPFVFPGGTGGVHALIHHGSENALFAASQTGSAVCSGGSVLHLSIYKLPLSSDGTRVVGPVTCGQAIVDPAGGEVPVNWSLLPSGDLLLVVDTNSNAQQPRMLVVDRATLATSTFASNGSYIGAAATNAGTYSTARGAAVILDTFSDVLRVFAAGSSGNGSVLANGVSSGGGSGEVAVMFEIEPAGISRTLKPSIGSLSLLAGGTQLLDFAPGASFAGAIHVIAGSTTGWTPGIPIGGFVVPLIYDSYTDYTLTYANLGPLFNNVGVVGGTGSAQAQLVVPPGSPGALAGLDVFHAAVVLTPGLAPNHVSNPVVLTLLP